MVFVCVYIYIYVLNVKGGKYIYMMMPKCSPVRYTIPALEQPVPENKKIQRNTF